MSLVQRLFVSLSLVVAFGLAATLAVSLFTPTAFAQDLAITTTATTDNSSAAIAQPATATFVSSQLGLDSSNAPNHMTAFSNVSPNISPQWTFAGMTTTHDNVLATWAVNIFDDMGTLTAAITTGNTFMGFGLLVTLILAIVLFSTRRQIIDDDRGGLALSLSGKGGRRFLATILGFNVSPTLRAT